MSRALGSVSAGVRWLDRRGAAVIATLICFAVWWFGAGAFYLYLASNFDGDAGMDRKTLILNAAIWPHHLFGYLIGTKQPPTTAAAARFRSTLRNIRIALIVGALACMMVIYRDIAPKLNLPVLHVALAPRHVFVDMTALEERAIEGPAVITAYYDAGYAWAAAEAITSAAQCPNDNRAYLAGCRSYFAEPRRSQTDEGEDGQ